MVLPANFEALYNGIKKMRAERTAPVDTIGPHMAPDLDAPKKLFRYQLLVALMLSSQTKERTTYDAMQRLKEHNFTPEGILKLSEKELSDIIHPVSFKNVKAKHIQKTTRILMEEYDGDIPDEIEDMVKLPGVGQKMGHIVMRVGWDKVTGISVDTHVHRICNRLGFCKTKTPEHTRVYLEKSLPQEFNIILVGFGQETCRPVGPKCGVCVNSPICPKVDLLFLVDE